MMADTDLEGIQEQIRKLEKEKEEIERKNRERQQLEQRLRQLREDVSSHKTSSNSKLGAGSSDRRGVSNKCGTTDQTEDLNLSVEDSQATLRTLQQSLLNISGGGASAALNDSREDSFRVEDEDDDVMTSEHKQALRIHRDIFVENMTPDDIFNDLISKHILSTSDVSRIKDKNTVEAINEELLNTLVKRSDRAFHVFVGALRRTLQGWLANKIDPGSQQRNKRKRKTGEINVNVDCERVVPVNRKRFACTCQEVEEQILVMAKGAFANLRRRDASASAFEQFKKELKQTNEVIKESMEIMNTLKILCRHGEITDLSEGSVCFTVRCASLTACHELWQMFESGDLLQACSEGLVTSYLLNVCGAKKIHLSLRISRLEYITCALELAYREKQALERRKKIKLSSIKSRLRQRLPDIQKENVIAGNVQRVPQSKGEAFRELPVNIVPSVLQPSGDTASFPKSISSEKLCASPSNLYSSHDISQQQAYFGEYPACRDIWLRSHGNYPDFGKFTTMSPVEPKSRILICPQRQKCTISNNQTVVNYKRNNQRTLKEDICPYNLRDRDSHLLVK